MILKIFIWFIFFIYYKSLYSYEDMANTASWNINIIAGIFDKDILLNFIFAIFVLIFTVILSKKSRSLIDKYLYSWNEEESTTNIEIYWILSRTINIVIWLVWITLSLWIMWVDISLFMWWIWLWIWFTLKIFLSNFLAWVIMVTQWTFKNKDLIEINWKKGYINKINSLTTEAVWLDWVKFTIPNSLFLEEKVLNYTSNDKRRLELDLELDKDTDITKAKKIITNVIDSFPSILKSPESQVWITWVTNWNINVKIIFWMYSRDISEWYFFTIKSNILETLNLAFRKYWIKIPFNQIMISKREEDNNKLNI